MVWAAFVTACRLAIWPPRRSPLSVKPTTVGVVRPPSLLGTICTAPPSSTETQQFVVPKSMPIAFPIYPDLLSCRNFHQGGTNQLVAKAVARNDLLYHCVGLVLVRSFRDHCFMNVRIKRFADGWDRFNSQRVEHAVELFPYQIDTTQKVPKLVRLRRFHRRLGFQRAFEIVGNRQQLRR